MRGESITMKVEASIGSSLESCFFECLRISKMLSIKVELEFNCQLYIIRPEMKTTDKIRPYHSLPQYYGKDK